MIFCALGELRHLMEVEVKGVRLRVRVAWLRNAPSLRRLTVKPAVRNISEGHTHAKLLQDFRYLAQLEHQSLGGDFREEELAAVVAPEHCLQNVTSLGLHREGVPRVATLLPLLVHLPALERLSIRLSLHRCVFADGDPCRNSVVAAEKGMKHLELDLWAHGQGQERAGQSYRAARDCSLHGSAASRTAYSAWELSSDAALSPLLAQLPLLRELSLERVRLDSLRFLREGSLSCTLESLELRELSPRMDAAEMV